MSLNWPAVLRIPHEVQGSLDHHCSPPRDATLPLSYSYAPRCRWREGSIGRWSRDVLHLPVDKNSHNDVMTMTCFLHYWPFVKGISSQRTRPVTQNFDYSVVVNVKNLLRGQWFWTDVKHLTLYVLFFFRENINIYLHFMSFLHIDLTQVLKTLPQVREGPTYSIESISWLLMSWRRKEPGHQQSWYWPR